MNRLVSRGPSPVARPRSGNGSDVGRIPRLYPHACGCVSDLVTRQWIHRCEEHEPMGVRPLTWIDFLLGILVGVILAGFLFLANFPERV